MLNRWTVLQSLVPPLIASVLHHFLIVTRKPSFIRYLSALLDNTFQFITPSFCDLMVVLRYSLHKTLFRLKWNHKKRCSHRKKMRIRQFGTQKWFQNMLQFMCVWASIKYNKRLSLFRLLSLRHLFLCVRLRNEDVLNRFRPQSIQFTFFRSLSRLLSIVKSHRTQPFNDKSDKDVHTLLYLYVYR